MPSPFPVVPPDSRMPVVVAMGVIGGIVVGSWAFSHMFKEGLTEDERKNILGLTATGLLIWGVAELLGQEKAWWLSVDGIYNKAIGP